MLCFEFSCINTLPASLSFLFVFVCLFVVVLALVSETGFLCVVSTVLELSVDQASLKSLAMTSGRPLFSVAVSVPADRVLDVSPFCYFN